MRRALTLLGLALTASLSACSEDPPPDPNLCVPGDCSALGVACGPTRTADGACIICGSCTLPLTCGGGGVTGQCGCAPPVCEAGQCGELADRCGGAPVVCPTMCTGGDSCGGAGVENRCGKRVAHGEACGPSAICGDGDACCGGTCVMAGPGGVCPQPGADMIVVPELLTNSFVIENLVVTPTECSIADMCVPGPGTYRLLRFATQTKNVGSADLVIGDPRVVPAEFVFAQCHGHNHYVGYTEYRLLDAGGRQVTRAFKAGFCIEDTERDPNDPRAAANAKYFCDPEKGGIQGIQAGWSDVYLANLDCQWVDISQVAPGEYTLEVEVNPLPRRFHEASYDNNVARVPVTIPPR